MGRELLLEIGTEEIPARFLPPVLEEMAVSFRKMLDAERIGVGEILTWGTPRRLALVAREVAEVQAEVTQEIIGPPKAVAVDAAGQPTPAAAGFARAQGVAVSDLIEVDTPRGVYLAVKKSTTGRPTAERLPDSPSIPLEPEIHALGSDHHLARPSTGSWPATGARWCPSKLAM
jgi:glycyl-tRNA synthetase beta chain